MENKIALRHSAGNLLRGKPIPPSEVVQLLAADAGVDEASARAVLDALLQWISQTNLALQAGGKRYTILPIKLHHFMSQTGSVYTTLDQDGNRFITLEPKIFKSDDDSKKPVLPNVFSRASGHEVFLRSEELS